MQVAEPDAALQSASQHVRMELPAPSSLAVPEAQAVSVPVRAPAVFVRADVAAAALLRTRGRISIGQTVVGTLSLLRI